MSRDNPQVRRRRSTWLWLLAAALVGGAACSDATTAIDEGGAQRGAEQQRQPIVGGEVDESHTASMVFVFEIGDKGVSLCSGTLIAPNVLLTAQHCVTVDPPSQVRCGHTSFNGPRAPKNFKYVSTDTDIRSDTGLSSSPEYSVGIDEVVVPEGKRDGCGDDIAMLILSEPVPSSQAEPLEPRIDEHLSEGGTFTAVGHGRDGDKDDTAGVRRSRGMRTVEFRCGGDYCKPTVDGNRVAAGKGEFVASVGICHGDSGGGALHDGRVWGVGVRSMGGGACGQPIYTALVPWRDWIVETAARAAAHGGYRTPDWAGDGPDRDDDGIWDEYDNCKGVPNTKQRDDDGDGSGDACAETDGDDVPKAEDNCPNTANADQADQDDDGTGDACEDSDDDGLLDAEDNCPNKANPEQKDENDDGTGDLCGDADGDGVLDGFDICPETPDPDQEDWNNNAYGDACEDADGDGVLDIEDNCPNVGNPDQADGDNDGIGDACIDQCRSGGRCPQTGGSMDAGGGGDDSGGGDNGLEPADSGCSAVGGGRAPVGSVGLVLLMILFIRRQDGVAP